MGTHGRGSMLGDRLRALEGAPYPAYRDLRGDHAIGAVTLNFLSIQPDPFAPPSRISVRIPLEDVGIDPVGLSGPSRTATEDFLARGVEAWLRGHGDVGSVVRIDPAPQQILRRSAVTLGQDAVTLLLFADLPARGRRIEGRRAAAVLEAGLSRLVQEAVLHGSWDSAGLARHRASAEDHAALTSMLRDRGWIAFAADGSRLARHSGERDTPMGASCIPLEAPSGGAAEVVLPHAGRIRGLAIQEGITLLCGGGFHGKSTLLRALGTSVYPHVPGDGRERIATEPSAMAVRAEDGRAILGVDLSPFIQGLPDGRDTRRFFTNNASGSTSQAAAIVEAVEAGCRCLLIDEDTSATNFLLRDPWMARLLREDQEPIVPLLARAREMRDRLGVSMLLVVGGSGEGFRVADRALLMDHYRPRDATERVHEIRRSMEPLAASPPTAWSIGHREIPLDALRSTSARVRARGMRSILVGNSECDLGASLALVSEAQANTLACVLRSWLEDRTERVALPRDAEDAAARIRRHGPLSVLPELRGDLAEVRAQEIAMLVNRLRRVADDVDAGDPGPGGTRGDSCG